MKEEIESIKNYALENNVPIMQDDGINYLTNYIKKNKIKKILEIGTAIGYSAIMMCLVDNDIEVSCEDYVIVETERGLQFGKVCVLLGELNDGKEHTKVVQIAKNKEIKQKTQTNLQSIKRQKHEKKKENKRLI